MAKTKLTGGPTIIGETVQEYAIGDPTEEGAAVTLQLTVTPKQAAQMFGRFVGNRKARGKGLPEEFTLLWVATSKGQNFLMRENEALRKRLDKAEERIDVLEKDTPSL